MIAAYLAALPAAVRAAARVTAPPKPVRRAVGRIVRRCPVHLDLLREDGWCPLCDAIPAHPIEEEVG